MITKFSDKDFQEVWGGSIVDYVKHAYKFREPKGFHGEPSDEDGKNNGTSSKYWNSEIEWY